MEEIYRAHFGFVWAVLRRLGVPDRDLEDVAQDVFIVVHRRLPEFEGRASTRTWLYAIALRVACNHRRRARVREPAAEPSATGLVAPALTSDPEEHALRTQAGRVLDELLGRLDDDKRAVFVLSDIEGLTAAEIAEIVGTNPRTVYSRLRAARDRVHGDLRRMQSREQSAADRRRWLRAAASEDAPPARAEGRVWAALCLRLPQGAAIATSSGGAIAAATGWSTATQAITISAALGVAGLGAVWVATAPMRDRAPTAAIDPAAIDPAAIDPAEIDQAEIDPAEIDQAEIDQASPERGDADSAPAIAMQPPPTEASRGEPPSPTPPATTRTPSPQGRRAAPRETPADDPLVHELRLLERARDAIERGDASAAVDELDEHARRFPRSALATDRDRLRVKAEAIATRRP